MLNLDPLRERLTGPFSPFAIRLTDGRTFEIPQRVFIAIGRGVVAIVGGRDCTHTVDAPHLVSINELPARRKKP